MFKATLLATTVLAVGASVAFAHPTAPKPHLPKDLVAVATFKGQPVTAVVVGHNSAQHVNNNQTPVNDAGKTFSNLSKDKNAEFISFYGWTIDYAQYSYVSTDYNYKDSYWYHDAIPIVGTGKAVSTIQVPMYGTGKFVTGIYSNNASNVPGNVIVSATFSTAVTTSECCSALQTISIPSTTLNSGTTYWVEVSAAAPSTENSETYGLWLMNDTNESSGANHDMYQYHDYYEEDGTTYSNVTSSWTAETTYSEPAAKVK